MWSHEGHTFNLKKIKLKEKQKGKRKGEERRNEQRIKEEERERGKISSSSLRSTKLGWSSRIGPRLKVGVLDERYAWVPKKMDFAEDPSGGDFGKSRLSGLGGFLPVDHVPRGKEFFLPWLIFHLRVIFGLG